MSSIIFIILAFILLLKIFMGEVSQVSTLTWMRMDFRKLRIEQSREGIQDNLPTKDVMNAISKSKRMFTVNVKKIAIENIESLSHEQLVHESLHSGIYEYHFMHGRKYLSLDESKHVEAIREIDHNYLVHCPSLDNSHADVGDVIIASDGAMTVHSDALGHMPVHKFMQQHEIKRNKGF